MNLVCLVCDGASFFFLFSLLLRGAAEDGAGRCLGHPSLPINRELPNDVYGWKISVFGAFFTRVPPPPTPPTTPQALRVPQVRI